MSHQILKIFVPLTLSCILVFQLGSQPALEQQMMMAINAGWSMNALTPEQSLRVAQSDSYTEKIQLHLNLVADKLAEQTAFMNINTETRIRRLALIDTLYGYAACGQFPRNNKALTPTPVFLDDNGIQCAVGYLLHASGQDQLVGTIAFNNNLSYIHELDTLYPELGQWAQTHGFSVQELAWIQPQYVFSCNPEIAPGEIIHVTCYGECTGAFYPDYTLIDLPPDAFLTWDDTYEWNDAQGEWVNISSPDCLCPGTYRQAFQVSSFNGDSMYVVYIEAEILSPEQISGNGEVNGEAGLCRAYIDPLSFGGVAPYTYDVIDIAGNLYGMGPLCEGYYYLITRDANDCIAHDILQVYTPESDCQAFSVEEIAISGQMEDGLNVTIKITGDSSSYISLPFYAEITDSEGSALAWCLNAFNQYGGDQQTFPFETITAPFSLEDVQKLQLEFNETLCFLPVPAVTTSIPELSEIAVSLYPNPMKDAAILSWHGTSPESGIQLFDIQGQQLRSWRAYDQNTTRVERENLPQGLYTIKVTNAFSTGTCRMVVLE